MKQRSHVIQLKPNNQQATYFEKACGCQRFAYNYGLAAWKTEHEAAGNGGETVVREAGNTRK